MDEEKRKELEHVTRSAAMLTALERMNTICMVVCGAVNAEKLLLDLDGTPHGKYVAADFGDNGGDVEFLRGQLQALWRFQKEMEVLGQQHEQRRGKREGK